MRKSVCKSPFRRARRSQCVRLNCERLESRTTPSTLVYSGADRRDLVFDPTRNRRNDPAMRSAFEAQGEYFRAYDDAGFVADAGELLAVHRRLDASGQEAVAAFHVHRRQPANFSLIDSLSSTRSTASSP